jgi:type IV secretion system protein VirB10
VSESGDNGQRHDVDESGSLVAGPSRRQLTTWQKLGVAALVLVVCLSFIWIGNLSRTKTAAQRPEVPFPPNNGTFRAAPLVAPPQPTPALPMPAPSSPPLLARPARDELNPADSPIFAFGGSGTETGPPSIGSTPLVGSGGSEGAKPASTGTENALSLRLRPTVLQPVKAELLPHPDMLITQGTIIPCTLQTAINTELAGYAKCVLPQDVRGTTGNVVLLDRGTTLIGEIQSGLMQGQDRVFVLWDRAETPDHAIIALSSPGTDELGRSGLPGAVNYHFWQRFGGAILLSVIQGAFDIGAAAASNSGSGNNTTVFNSFQSNGQQLADTSLRATINIPPTLEKNQGDNIAIFVAKDLDFSDIYKLLYTGYDYGR